MPQYKYHKQYRYKGYDYAKDGFYFVTICTKDRQLFFGDVVNEKMQLSKIGQIAEKYWLEISNHFKNIKLHEYIIMPNHIHGIIQIMRCGNEAMHCGNEAMPRSYDGKHIKMSKISPKLGSLSVIIGSFKSIVTKIINKKFLNNNFAWQPRFHDRIIRNDEELNKIRYYITINPDKWALDRSNPNKLTI